MEAKAKISIPESKLNFSDKAYHFCIGLLPFLSLFNVPIINISLGTVLILLFIPHSLIYIYEGLRRGDKWKASIVPFFLFYMYMTCRFIGNLSGALVCVGAFVNLWGMSYGSIRIKKIRSILETYALINLVLIIIQLLAYYIGHIRFSYLPGQLLYSEFTDSMTAVSMVGLFRPAALFLEPAHYSQYCCFALISCLFPSDNEKPNLKKAVLIGTGCVLSTSGMGIALTFCIFLWYIIVNQTSKGSKLLTIMKWVPVVAIVIVILFQIPFFQTAIQRVFSESDGYNAIEGRTGNWGQAMETMHGMDLWIGFGYDAKYPFYLSGIPDTIYKYGIVAVVLEFLCFFYMMIKKKSSYVWCGSIAFLSLLFVAHLTSFYLQVFYMGIILADVTVPKKYHIVEINLGFGGTIHERTI